MKKPFLKINNEFFHNKNPLIIAEIGNNHQGSLQKCKDLFLAAKNSGANAVKLQKEQIKKYILRKHLTKFIIVKIHLQKHMVFIENIWNLENLSILN